MNSLQDFLRREERRRNRSLSKRFCAWLEGASARIHVQKIERVLAKPGREDQACRLLKIAEEAYKADDAFKRQDNKRKKSLKQFHKAFEDWLKDEKGQAYDEEIANAKSEELRELARLDAEKAFARANPHLLPDDYKDASKTRIRPIRMGRASSVDSLSLAVIEPGLNQLGLVGADILRHWASIVGEVLAQNTRPERVRFAPTQRSNGTLYVQARAGFNTIIQHNSPQIIFRVNSHFGFKAIEEIRISKHPFDERETTGNRVSSRILAARVEPANHLCDHLASVVAGIEDEKIRKAFEELGKVVQARNG